jgi:hypothetical protein
MKYEEPENKKDPLMRRVFLYAYLSKKIVA